MNEMVERLDRKLALWLADYDALLDKEQGAAERKAFRCAFIRELLAEMREPTAQMVEASHPDLSGQSAALEAWRAMIDVGLAP